MASERSIIAFCSAFGFGQILANFAKLLRPLDQRSFAALLFFRWHRLVDNLFNGAIGKIRCLLGLSLAGGRAVRRPRKPSFKEFTNCFRPG